MFTGIITHLGKVISKTDRKLEIEADSGLVGKLSFGTSIAVDGICLTVTGLDRSFFEINYMEETMKKTNIKYLQVGDLVNLELPATAETFLSGHIVQGHVDGLAKLEDIKQLEGSRLLKFSIDPKLMRYVAEKGSIALNGISLTIIDVGNDYFIVGIIPHTWEKTMLQDIKVGDFVNIEVDILAKYLDKLKGR